MPTLLDQAKSHRDWLVATFSRSAETLLAPLGGWVLFVSFAGPGTPTGPLSFGWQLIAAMIFAAVLTGCLAWFVDFLVFKRDNTHNTVVLHLNNQI